MGEMTWREFVSYTMEHYLKDLPRAATKISAQTGMFQFSIMGMYEP
jgi:hypothetical protein